MPSYNTEEYIAQSIESVICQTYKNWELIIVDDCSTDKTKEIVNSFSDSRIKFIQNNYNRGAAICRNRALSEAKGIWIAFLDSDDIWMPDKLEKQISFMENVGCSFSYTKYEEIDSKGKRTGIIVSGPQRITRRSMYNYCWPGCLTVMYDIRKVGLIQIENIKKNNDYAMWLKAIKYTDCYLLDEILALYRRGRTGSISTHGYISLIKWHYRLFRFAEKESVIASICNTLRNILFGIYKKKHYTINSDIRRQK